MVSSRGNVTPIEDSLSRLTVNDTVARLSDGPQLQLQPFPQVSDARAQRTAAVAKCGKEGRGTARQCRPLSMCELIRLTHHQQQGRALSAIDIVRGRLVITKLRHGCTGDGAHVRVVAHERRAGLTNVRVGHVGTGKDSRVQAGEHVLSAATFLPSAAGTSN